MKRCLFLILAMSLVPAIMGQAPDDTTGYKIQKAYTDLNTYRDSLQGTNADYEAILNRIFARYLSIQWRQEKTYSAETLWKKQKPKTAPMYAASETQRAVGLEKEDTPLKDNDITSFSDSIGDSSISIPSKEILMSCLLKDTSIAEVETLIYNSAHSCLHEIAQSIARLKERHQLDSLRTADVAFEVADSLSRSIEVFLADSLHKEWVEYVHREAYVQITTFILLRILDYDVYLGQTGSGFFIFGKNVFFARKETYEKNVILTLTSSFSIEDVPMSIFFNKRIIHPSDLIDLIRINPLELDKPLRVYSLQFENPHHYTRQNETPAFHVQIRLKEIDRHDVCRNQKTPDNHHYCYIFSGFDLNGVNNSMSIDSIDSIDSISATPHIILFYDRTNWLNYISNGKFVAKFYGKIRNDTLFVAYIPYTIPDKEEDLYPAFVFCTNIMRSIHFFSFPWILDTKSDNNNLRQFEVLSQEEISKILEYTKNSMSEGVMYPESLKCGLIFRQTVFPLRLCYTLLNQLKQ